MKRTILLVACLSVWSAQALPLGADVPSLLNYVQEHNPELAAQRFEADAASMRVQPAGSLPDPVLRTELMDITNQGTGKPPSLLPSKVGGTRYLLMQSVPWFGKLGLQSEVAEAQAAGARGQAAVTWSELAGKIKSAYAMHYYLTQSIRLTKDALDLTGNLEKIAQTRYANGLATQQEVIRVQLEKSDLQASLIEQENEQHHAHSRLNALLSRPAHAELAEPEILRPLPGSSQLTRLDETLRAHNPALKVADANIIAAEKSRDLALLNRYPGFTLGVAPTQSGNSVKSWDMMVEFNIPLQQASRRAWESEAEAKLAASNARQVSLLNQMQSELSENISALESARRTEAIIQSRLLPQAKLLFESAMSGYTTGKVDFPSLLDAQRQIIRTRQQGIKAQYEAQLRLAEIERLIGEEL